MIGIQTLLRPLLRARPAGCMEAERAVAEPAGAIPSDRRSHRSGELLEAIFAAASAGVGECPVWLIAAIEDCERGEANDRRLQ